MGVDAKWGRFPICPEMSRFVPVCPLLSFLGPGTRTNRDKRGQTGTKRDISGHIGKRPHLASTPVYQRGKNNININFSGRIPGGRTPGKAPFSRTQKVYARPFSTVKHREFLA